MSDKHELINEAREDRMREDFVEWATDVYGWQGIRDMVINGLSKYRHFLPAAVVGMITNYMLDEMHTHGMIDMMRDYMPTEHDELWQKFLRENS
jgi:hypothetical protein